MKKIFIAVILFIAVNSSYACNICGCGGGNTYMGLMPNFKNHFFGLRYNYASFHTQLLNDLCLIILINKWMMMGL